MIKTQCVPRLCASYRTFFCCCWSWKSPGIWFFFFVKNFLLCSKNTLGNYSILIKKNLAISWNVKIISLIFFITTVKGNIGQYLHCGLEGDAGAIEVNTSNSKCSAVKGIAAHSHCIWSPWRGGVNPRTSSCVRNSTFWADLSLEAGESIWSKLYPACSGSWCESPGDCAGTAYLTPPSTRQPWHRTVSNELMIWCETLWLRAEHRHHQWKGLHKQSRQVVINKYSMNYQMILQSFPCKATAGAKN